MNKSHLLPPNLTLFGYQICPYVLRVRYILSLLELDHHYIELDVYASKPAQLLRYSPMGRVPALIIDNDALCDSTVISQWLSQVYAEHQLLPTNTWAKAKMMNDMAAIDSVHDAISQLISAVDKAAFNAALMRFSHVLPTVLTLLRAPCVTPNSLLDVWAMVLAHLVRSVDAVLQGVLSERIPHIRSLPDIYRSRESASVRYQALLPKDYLTQLHSMMAHRNAYCVQPNNIALEEEEFA
ncbi:hypothetical protein PCIT_a3908 [Pseudoalteromonas citrea]|uniref:GST N-terminal domain-containing protein n=2 Tax=Pseudoalteromonas citrea TaxID=43655 RepID=A0AAD4AGH1_9GAMM|nr:glutathione S-transferase N-terminal domain-containing protein [Pseudoalteromonas citrea]KAF7767810.1 hypothetical protein PCIT_a3908 [Pseudoalteromonas citrea]